MIALPIAVGVVLLLLGAWAMWLARGSLEVVRRASRDPTRPIARLAAGPADEASVLRHFRRPAVLLAWLGAISWLAAALLAAATYVLWSYGG